MADSFEGRTWGSLRVKGTKFLCRALPPIISQRLRQVLCPHEIAQSQKIEFSMKSWTGSRLSGNTDDYHLCRFYFHGYFEWRNLAIAQAVCSKGDTIVEIGANVGTETFSYADIVGSKGHVFAFEPVPANVLQLKKSLAANPGIPVTLFPIALAAQRGNLAFILPRDHRESGLGRLASHMDEGEGDTIDVEVALLNDFAQQIQRARLIMMDVEGHELSVLRGAHDYLEKYHPVIVLEADDRWIARAGGTPQELFNELAGLSYRIYRISRMGLAPLQIDGPVASDCGHSANWLALPRHDENLAPKIASHLIRGAITPLGLGLNPLERV